MKDKIINNSNRRIIDPSKIIDVEEAKLNKSLYVPSFVHGYSLAVEYLHDWFLSKFKDGFFKTIHMTGKNVLEDFRKYEIGELVAREKPMLSINPEPNMEYDREKLDLYNYGPDIIINRSTPRGAFFKDTNNNIYLSFNMEAMEIRCNYKARVRTRAEQLDLAKKMELMFKVGGTFSDTLIMDFHLQYEMMLNIAEHAGFIITDDNKIADPYGFLRYLNKYSEMPILMKFRGINGRYEYFLRAKNIYLWISNLDKLELDTGERSGQTDTNFNIDMNVTAYFSVPKYFIFYSKDKVENGAIIKRYLDDEEENNLGAIGSLYTFKIMETPEKDEHGWLIAASTDYINDEQNITSLDLKQFLDQGELKQVIDSCLNNFLSPSSFLNLKTMFDKSGDTFCGMIKSKIDWENYQLTFENPLPIGTLRIMIYMDREFKNNEIAKQDKAKETRIKSM